MTDNEAKSRLEWIYKNHKCLSLESKHCYEAIKMGVEALENQPIHCKDCEFYMPEKEHRCFLLPKIHPTEDWFCGFAKRKENK